MKEKTKRYRLDHDSIVVPCPQCGEKMTGWIYQLEWRLYLIQHAPPNEFGKECWIEGPAMKHAMEKWEQKYELIEVNV